MILAGELTSSDSFLGTKESGNDGVFPWKNNDDDGDKLRGGGLRSRNNDFDGDSPRGMILCFVLSLWSGFISLLLFNRYYTVNVYYTVFKISPYVAFVRV